MARFQRPRENSGRVFIGHVSPFLDAIERIFGYRRLLGRREPGPSGGSNQAMGPGPSHANPNYGNYGGGGTLRLSTVLQPGPYSLNRAVHYSIRARRMAEGGLARSRPTPNQQAPQTSEEGNPPHHDPDPNQPSPLTPTPPTHHVNVRLRRDLLRDWERSVSVYRSGAMPPPPSSPSPSFPQRNSSNSRNEDDGAQGRQSPQSQPRGPNQGKSKSNLNI